MKQVIERLVDDLDRESDAVETIRFGLDDRVFEIDLTADHAAELRRLLDRYVDAARVHTKLGFRYSHGPSPVAQRSPAAAMRLEQTRSREIREWARTKKIAVSPFGRIKQDIIDRYDAEQAAIRDAKTHTDRVNGAAKKAAAAAKQPAPPAPEPAATLAELVTPSPPRRPRKAAAAKPAPPVQFAAG